MRWLIVISLLGLILGLVEPEEQADQAWKNPMLVYQPQAVVTTKVYSSEESKELFGKDLPNRGFFPIEITIQNKSSKKYLISSTLNKASPKDIARDIRKSSVGRGIGYKLLGFIFWPAMIPGTVDSIKGHVAYNEIQNTLAEKMLKEEDEIEPHSTAQGFIYVPGGEPDFYTITLTEVGTGLTETIEFLTPQITT